MNPEETNQTEATPETEQTSNETPTPETQPEGASSDATSTETSGDGIDHSALMGILCYLGPLVFIPYITDRENPFIKFHIKQGLALFAVAVVSYFAGMFLMFIPFINLLLIPFILLFNLFLLVLVVLGIVHVVKGEQKTLPLIGSLAKKFNI